MGGGWGGDVFVGHSMVREMGKGVAGDVARDVARGTAGGIANGIAECVTSGITEGIAEAIEVRLVGGRAANGRQNAGGVGVKAK